MHSNFNKLKKAFLLMIGLFIGFSAFSQTQKTVRGTVKDVKGEAIIGASILIQGTTSGVATDVDGNFTLQVPSNGTLVVSSIGYLTQTVAVGNRSTINIVMKEDNALLDEVVVIGYGSVRKNDATGSVTAIKPEQMNKGLTVNPQDMISGKVAGVTVTQNGGAPGEGATIRIRGGSSLNASNDPLIVIDGLAMDNNGIQGVSNFLSTINPNDIESFTVLKDASATAIYGSRASNGVILIQTKKGLAGMKPTIAYNGNFSISTPRNYIDVMNGDAYREYANKLYAGDQSILNKLGTDNTDWQKQIYRTGYGTDQNINVAGGFKNLPYRASVGYTGQSGILKTSTFQRFTGALNLSPSFLDNSLKVNFNLKGMYIKNRFADTGAVGDAVRFDPTHPVMSSEEPFASLTEGYWQWATYNDNGSFKALNADAPRNPLGLLNQKKDLSNAWNVIGNLEFDYKMPFLPELRAHLALATDIAHGRQNTWVSPMSSTNMNGGGYDGYRIQDKWNRQLSTYLQYTKDFTNQNLDLMAGYEWQRYHREGGYYGKSITNPDYIYQKDIINWATHNQLVSFFGRLNYSLLDRYLFTATMRADGSSRFAPGNKWGIFPSFAFAWKMKNEDFLKDNGTISDMKLRLGYGVTGQQDIGLDFPYLPVYTINKDGAYYPIGDTYYPTHRPDAYNDKLKWEQTKTYNIGYDIAFLQNRFSASLDYYYRVTTDLINQTAIPAGTNFRNKVLQNIGSLNNQGVELMLNGTILRQKDFTWDVNYNVTYNRNRITKLTSGSQEGYYVPTGGIFQGSVQAHSVGYPANSFYVYQQVYDNDGKPIEGLFVDRNGDDKINEQDKYFYHKATPDVTMGLSTKVVYKAFDFGISTRANFGNYVYNAVAAERMNVGPNGVWSPLGFFENKVMSAFDTNFTGNTGNAFMSDYYVQNASFFRVDNITLGYSFANIFNSRTSGRFSATVQNPLVITSYKGLDPEVVNVTPTGTTIGIDGSLYPKPVMVVFGLSLNF